MWPWREWVIQAYNQNLPYDQFAIKQLAGDLLPGATQDDKIASGFNRNNDMNIKKQLSRRSQSGARSGYVMSQTEWIPQALPGWD
jgi:hypothetical protein